MSTRTRGAYKFTGTENGLYYDANTDTLSLKAGGYDLTIPQAAAGTFVMTVGTQTIGGAKTFSAAAVFSSTINVAGAATLASAVITAGATVGTTLGVTGVLTPTGGIAAAGGFSFSARGIHTGGVPATQTTDGNDTTPSTTETYIAEVNIPANCTVTGISVMNGSAVGTDKLIGILYDSTGAVVANSALAGITASGTDAYQALVFTAPYAAKGPATYYVGIQVNGTTYRLNTHILGNFGASKKTGETFGTATTITPPTTFTANQGPIASLY